MSNNTPTPITDSEEREVSFGIDSVMRDCRGMAVPSRTVRELEQKLGEATAALSFAHEKLAAITAENATLKEEILEENECRIQAQSALATARAQLAEMTRHAEKSLDALAERDGEVFGLRSRLAEVERERDALSGDQARVVKKIETICDSVPDDQPGLEKILAIHDVAMSELEADRDSLRAQLEAVTKERDDYRQMTHQAEDYVTKIGNLLGCADGDDTPELRISAITTALAAAEKALLVAVELRTDQNCPPENHEVVIVAQDALDRIRAQQPQGGGKEDNG